MGGKHLPRIVAKGQWGTIEWATNANGKRPAQAYFHTLSLDDQAKVLRLFRRLADNGFIKNKEQFKKLVINTKGKGIALWEFKSFQHRFLGDYRPNKRFIIAHGLRKKRDDLPAVEIQKGVEVLQENDDREKR